MRKEITKFEIVLLIAIVGFFLINLGAFMNFQGVIEGRGRMPVHYEEFSFSDEKHYSYTWDNKPENWIVTDIISIKFSAWSINSVWSIGDFLLSLGVITLLFGMVGWIFLNVRQKDG